MQIETRLMDELSRYLDLASDEAKLTAANMANIDTPGYQAVGMNFSAEMESALKDVNTGAEPPPVDVEKVDGLVARPDGNDVSMDREGLNLAQAQLQYRTGIALWHDEYQRVIDAVHAS